MTMQDEHAQNGHGTYTPPGQPIPAAPAADLDADRATMLDMLGDEHRDCIPYGPRKNHTLYPCEASAMLASLYRDDPKTFMRLYWEARGGDPKVFAETTRTRRNRKPASE
jgi:hypothetical protein